MGTRKTFRKGRRLQVETLEGRTLLTRLMLTVDLTGDTGAYDGSTAATSTSGDIRWAVNRANAWADADGSRITFATSLSGQKIKLTSPLSLTEVSGPEELDGAGLNVAISGENAVRVIQVLSGTSAVITGLTISGGAVPKGSDGGGVLNQGSLILEGCSVDGNYAGRYGGGIDNSGTLELVSSRVNANDAGLNGTGPESLGLNGSGIENEKTGTAQIVNSLITNNTNLTWGDVGNGGGIDNWGSVTCQDSTIAYNGGGLDDEPGGTATLENTIVALNVYISGFVGVDLNLDVFGAPVSKASSYNLIGTGGSGGLIDGSNGNRVGVADPGLDGNGIPLPGSPAIDTGSSPVIAVDPATGLPLVTDLVGNPRQANGVVDIGAYEYLTPAQPATVYTVTNTSADAGTWGSLPWAVDQADHQGQPGYSPPNPAGSLIRFDPTAFPTDSASPQEIVLTQSISIDAVNGPVTVQGPGLGSLIVAGGDPTGTIQTIGQVNTSGLTIESSQGSSLVNSGTLTLSACSISGEGGSVTGIFNIGLLRISDSTVSASTTGIFSEDMLWVDHCTITGCTNVGVSNTGAMWITDSTVSHNGGGPGPYAVGGVVSGDDAMAVLIGCTVDDNASIGLAAGIISSNGGLILTDCTFSGNTGGYYASAVFANYYLTMTNCTVVGNTTSSDGAFGAVYAQGVFAINNSILVGNTVKGGSESDFFGGFDSNLGVDIPGVYDSSVGFIGNPASEYNLIGQDGSNYLSGFSHNSLGVTAATLGLDPHGLQNNGGLTQTVALLPGSQAIDAGSNSIPGVSVPTADQRGALRGPAGLNAGSAPDIGAFEYVTYSAPATVPSTATASQVQNFIQDAAPAGGPVNLQAASSAAVTSIVQAVNALPSPPDPQTNPVNITLDLGGGTYTTDTHITAPAGVNVVIANGTLVGGSPALIVDSGNVLLNNVTAENATNAPTIVVNGGTLTVRNSVIQESSGYAQTAIVVTGGTVDLGTAASPGGNTINVNGAGQWAVNASPTPISAVGDTFTVNGAAAPSSLSGVVFSDFNDDGQVDFGEKGIPGVTVNLDGTDFLGNPVHLSQTTDKAGTYVFLNLSPGSYAVTLPTQPAGYTPGKDTVGTGGGAISAGQFTVALPAGIDALNYNYGELPAASGPVRADQTAGIGFWNNKNGQALIKGLNGGVGTQLGDWLAATFPHMFASLSGTNNLAGKNNAYVASFFQSRFVLRGVKLDAQVLASALAVYVTDSTLDSTAIGTRYGFLVSGNGVGTATVSVGDDGSAFGVANCTKLTVLDLLWYVDSQTVNGVLYNGDAKKRNDANEVFSEMNEVGDD